MSTYPHTVTFAPDQIIFHEGDAADLAYVVEGGSVEITVRRDGRDIVLAKLETGDVFGELALINRDPRSATARAIDSVQALAIDRDAFEQKMAAADPVIGLFMRTLLERFHEARGRLIDITSAAKRTSFRLRDRNSQHNPLYVDNLHNALSDLHFADELDRALHENELALVYQPVVHIDSARVGGFEALIRWRRPDGQMLSPAVFIPFAERSGQILELGRWTFERACQDIQKFIAQRPDEPPFVSVNLSMAEFTHPNLAGAIDAAARNWSVAPQLLKLEITESVLMSEPEHTIDTLHTLHEIGLPLVVDDFGTGYSSFSYLSRFPLDSLKIDQSFTREITKQQRQLEIVRGITALAHNLGLSVIAEGVSSAQELAHLRAMECNYGQGQLFAMPLSLADAMNVLAESSSQARQGS